MHVLLLNYIKTNYSSLLMYFPKENRCPFLKFRRTFFSGWCAGHVVKLPTNVSLLETFETYPEYGNALSFHIHCAWSNRSRACLSASHLRALFRVSLSLLRRNLQNRFLNMETNACFTVLGRNAHAPACKSLIGARYFASLSLYSAPTHHPAVFAPKLGPCAGRLAAMRVGERGAG